MSHLYDEFTRAWCDGLVPDVLVFLDRTDDADARDELARRLDAFLTDAPAVQPTAEREAQLRTDPLFTRLREMARTATSVGEQAPAGASATVEVGADPSADVGRLAATDTGPQARPGGASAVGWHERLRHARREAGLSVEQLGERFAHAFGLAGVDARAAELLDGLESGTVAPGGITARATERLAALLSVPAATLSPPRPRPLFRASSDEATNDLATLLSEVAGALDARAIGDPPPGEASTDAGGGSQDSATDGRAPHPADRDADDETKDPADRATDPIGPDAARAELERLLLGD
ncbi:MAG: hypothetical protein AB7G37_12140 [Solirubrobacteraceae bacterium]